MDDNFKEQLNPFFEHIMGLLRDAWARSGEIPSVRSKIDNIACEIQKMRDGEWCEPTYTDLRVDARIVEDNVVHLPGSESCQILK